MLRDDTQRSNAKVVDKVEREPSYSIAVMRERVTFAPQEMLEQIYKFDSIDHS